MAQDCSQLGVERWIERVRMGEFDTIPKPFTWAKSGEFALLIHGYDRAREVGG